KATTFIQELESLPQQVKLFAVWPTMFVISHHLSKRNFEITFETFFGIVTIDTTSILQDLVEGAYGAWFSFGNDGWGLNQAEVAYAFSYAVAAGVFEDYGIKERDFFAEFLLRYLGPADYQVQRHLEFIKT